ncbi:hypothetical protein [Chryseobacterium fluminis]
MQQLKKRKRPESFLFSLVSLFCLILTSQLRTASKQGVLLF